MAKTQRMMIGLQCEKCKTLNYVSSKNKTNTPDKVVFHKFCKECRTATNHKETQKFK